LKRVPFSWSALPVIPTFCPVPLYPSLAGVFAPAVPLLAAGLAAVVVAAGLAAAGVTAAGYCCSCIVSDSNDIPTTPIPTNNKVSSSFILTYIILLLL